MQNLPPRGPKGVKCPLWKKSMHLVCHDCAWWCSIGIENPQTGEKPIWQCAVPQLVLVGLETSKQAMQNGAAVESFRNEMVRLNTPALPAAMEYRRRGLLDGPETSGT